MKILQIIKDLIFLSVDDFRLKYFYTEDMKPYFLSWRKAILGSEKEKMLDKLKINASTFKTTRSSKE